MTAARRTTIASGVAVVVLATLAWVLPDLRRALIFDITFWDAPPGEPPTLGGGAGPGLSSGPGPGLAKTPHTRVVVVDGLSRDVAAGLRAWTSTCARGTIVRVDVGFPTVSLPVEVALWTGLTQQQTGIVHRGGYNAGRYGRPLEPPLDRRGIPAQVPGSIAIAESHGWIARSLGFGTVHPAAGEHPAEDRDAKAWETRWVEEARRAVASKSPLVFVHVLRVDDAGHKLGVGAHYGRIAALADNILDDLLAAAPDARWFLISDHGHLGGHGGEEREVRHVEGCIAGPGVPKRTSRDDAPLIHIVDFARAIADSTGATLDPSSHARPLSIALGSRLGEDHAVPALALSRGVIGIFLLALALGATVWGITRRWWLAPWWFLIACAALLYIRGEPTLSTGFIYGPSGRPMFECWLPALAVALATTWFGLGRTTLSRVLAAQLAIPVLALAAVFTATGAWPALLGGEVAPVVPHYTAYMLALILMVSHGAAAVALAVLARLVRPRSGRREPAAPPRSAPAAGE